MINETVWTGRPDAKGDRPDREMRCYDVLDALKISYSRVDHAHANTIEDCKAVEAYLKADICKNLFLCNRQQTDFYLLIMEGDKPFKTKDLSKLIGTSRLSFGPAEKMEELLDVTPGSASILALMNDKDLRVQLVIDRPVIEKERFGCHPCNNTSSLNLATDDIINVFLPYVNHKAIVIELPDPEV